MRRGRPTNRELSIVQNKPGEKPSNPKPNGVPIPAVHNPPKERISFKIHTLTDKTFLYFLAKRTLTIRSLMRALETKTGISMGEQFLLFAGGRLFGCGSSKRSGAGRKY